MSSPWEGAEAQVTLKLFSGEWVDGAQLSTPPRNSFPLKVHRDCEGGPNFDVSNAYRAAYSITFWMTERCTVVPWEQNQGYQMRRLQLGGGSISCFERMQDSLESLSCATCWLLANVQQDVHSCGVLSFDATEAFTGSESFINDTRTVIDVYEHARYRIELPPNRHRKDFEQQCEELRSAH